jgi:hypothetical protein
MSTKKLLVLSDSHGKIRAVQSVFEWAAERSPPKGKICAVAFCGDGVSDLKLSAETTGFYSDWNIISGNNDYYSQLPDSAVFDFANHRFLICHGHRYNLYDGNHLFISAARRAGADVVLFGHSHIPYQKTEEGIFILNPGSVARSRSRIGETFAVIECTEGQPLKAEFFGIGEQGEINMVKVK